MGSLKARRSAGQEGLYALLRRLHQARIQLSVHHRVFFALDPLELEHEATCLESRVHVLEARLLPADLPACDLGPIAAQPFGQLGLCQARLRSCLADDLCAVICGSLPRVDRDPSN